MTLRANPHIAALGAYTLANLMRPDGKPFISLAQNESCRPPSPAAITAARRAMTDAALYPDPDWVELRAALAQVHDVAPETILCGAGSMELIAALAAVYLGPAARALTTEYAYLFFRTATHLTGGEIDIVPEAAFHVDMAALLSGVQPQTRVVFIANPGNPTGTRLPAATLRELRAGLPDDVLLVIDEAYGEFADAPGEALFDLAAQGNTVILRTLSKAYGLAGIRVGWGVFPPDVAAQMRKVLNPNNISLPAQAAATAAILDQDYMKETVRETAARRKDFATCMRGLGIDVPLSYTNFVLLPFASAETAAAADAALRSRGVLMRGMAGYGLPQCLRATIGADADIALAVSILTRHITGENPL